MKKTTVQKLLLALLTAALSGGTEWQFNDEMSIYTAVASLAGGVVAYFLGNSLHKADPPTKLLGSE